jgi:predicted lysophospholipase L1 biosynthesis ABC-type transport system permease subunit
MALGADGGSLLQLVARSVLAQLTAGVVVGVPLALLATRALQGLLFEIAPADPASFALAPLLLVAAGLAAALGPARRAARVDPVAALGSSGLRPGRGYRPAGSQRNSCRASSRPSEVRASVAQLPADPWARSRRE